MFWCFWKIFESDEAGNRGGGRSGGPWECFGDLCIPYFCGGHEGWGEGGGDDVSGGDDDDDGGGDDVVEGEEEKFAGGGGVGGDAKAGPKTKQLE